MGRPSRDATQNATHGATTAETIDLSDDGPVNSAEETFVKVVAVPDSEDARLFVELSSYGADLAEASHALDLAIESRGDELIESAADLLFEVIEPVPAEADGSVERIRPGTDG